MNGDTVYKRLLESIDDVVWQIDLQGRITYISPSVKRLYGYTPEEMIGRSYLEFNPSDLNKDSLETFRLLMEKGELRGYETEGISKSGDKIDLIVNISSVKDGDGNIIGFQGITHDITARKTMEEALRESEEKYRKVYENFPLGYQSLDEAGKLLDVNPSWVRILGYSRDEVLGKWFGNFLQPQSAERFRKNFPQLIEVGQIFGAPFEIINKNNDTMSVEIDGRAEFDDQGTFIRTHCIITNVTERKKIEEELIKSEKLESLGLFAGGIAHDFNNILTAIMGNVGTLKIQTHLEDSTYEKLVHTEKAIFRAKNLTSQLLTFARGGSPIKKTVSIEDILRESVDFVLSGSNVKCEFSIPEDLWPVALDEGQFSQVINNLVLNADQAMPEGGTIQITCRNVLEGGESPLSQKDGRCKGNYVKISIADEGVGIQEDQLEKVFDPYYTTKQRGSGLGLAIAYSIVDRHAGIIAAESTPGKGTTFHICLPATDKVPEKKEPDESILRGEGRILLMDDEEIVRQSVSSMLGGIGYRVDTAADGGDALEKYGEAKESGTPYDAVILDLTVPGGMGGKKTIVKLKEIDTDVKAVVSSGYSHDPVMANFKEYGFSGVLSKPFRMIDLNRVLRNILDQD